MDNFCDGEKLFSDEKGIIYLYFEGMGAVNPKVSAMFAVLIPQKVPLIDAEMLFTDDFSSKILRSWWLINPILLSLLLTTEDSLLLSWENEFSAYLLIVRLGFENWQFEVELERVIRQFELCIYDLIFDVFCIYSLSERETTWVRSIHSL